MSRKRIYEIIEVAEENDRLSAVYDSCMLLCILLSLIPLVFKEQAQTPSVAPHYLNRFHLRRGGKHEKTESEQ